MLDDEQMEARAAAMVDALDALIDGGSMPEQLADSETSICTESLGHADLVGGVQALAAVVQSIRGDDLPAFSLPGYTIDTAIGHGGMGVVYRAHQQSLNRRVAIKVLAPWLCSTPAAVLRFKREAALIGMLRHPNIVTVLDAGESDGQHYIVMEYIEGSDLSTLAEQPGGMSPDFALKCIREAGVGLTYAHKRGVLHRDIKPSNLLYDMAADVVKVTDLGLGQLAQPSIDFPASADVTTLDGAVLGTPGYIAPECVTGATPADARSDVFSLGRALARLIEGRVTPSLADGAALGRWRAQTQHIHRVVTIATAADPKGRYPSMQAFVDDLDRVMMLEFGMPSSGSRWKRTSRRQMVAGLLLSAVLGTAALAYRSTLELNSSADRRLVSVNTKATTAVAHRAEPPLTNSVGIRLISIAAGEFDMGTELTRAQSMLGAGSHSALMTEFLLSETPKHRVRISRPFYLAAHPVTIKQFTAFVEATGYVTDAERDPDGGKGWVPNGTPRVKSSKEFNWRNTGFTQEPDYPVVNVSWNDAVAFCGWLSKQEGVTYRLPTEAEWEYACRAGTTTRYSFSDKPAHIGAFGNVRDSAYAAVAPTSASQFLGTDGFAFTSPVGHFRPNAWGLYDMHGNVWEWCSDWFGAYPSSGLEIDPKGPTTGTRRVARGGAWNSMPLLFTCTSRAGSSGPRSRAYGTGFRVAREQ